MRDTAHLSQCLVHRSPRAHHARTGRGATFGTIRAAFTWALFLIALALGHSGLAHADGWAAPQVREIFSANRDHFVRVTPGTSIGDTFGFAGAPKGAFAMAEYYRRQPDGSYKPMQKVTLLNPVAPVDVFVADGGHLVTVDNWHNRGYGKILAVYDADGKLVRAYELTDLFLKAEIDSHPHSISSRAWHQGPVYLNKDQRTLYMMISSGRDLILRIETGRYVYCETRESQYRCRNSNAERLWVPYKAAMAGL